MKVKYFLTTAILAAAFAAPAIHAQGTLEDYNRAYALEKTYSARNIYNARVTPRWIPDTHLFWYVDQSPEGETYTLVNADKRTKRNLFNQKALAEKLTALTGKDTDPNRLALEHVSVNAATDSISFIRDGHRYLFTTAKKGNLTDLGELPPREPQPHWMVQDEERDAPPMVSPDGTKKAYIKNSNIYVANIDGSDERALSIDGTPGNYYSSYIHWSPDSKKVAACRIRPIPEKRFIYYVESSPADQLQPKLHKQEYAKPGDELMRRVPCIYDVETGKATIPSTELFDSQYELYGPMWDNDSKSITFEYNERGHKVYRVLELSAETGKVRPIIEEKSDKYVNYPRRFRHDLSDGRHIIWASERDNRNNLYMYDRQTAQPTHQITKDCGYLREVVKVDEPNSKIYFTANGKNENEDPYFIRYYSVNFDGTGLTDLTPATGMHNATFSSDMAYLVDTYSTVANPPATRLRDARNGEVVMEIADADISKLKEAGWEAPEVFVAPGRDGKTPMWGLIQRPTNFDPSKSYPVIEYIYQGPGDQYVPKTFISHNRYLTSLAELGFIVVMVDGMGTSFRTREFENVCYKNLADAGLPDHIAWIKAAGEKYPYMDLDRVGIYGCSAGGQESTNAVLTYPEFYKAAYSACGCHDNRMDKIWWNELWLGYPVDESYAKASNVENAHKLQRPLMLVVGELDDNVDPASTMQVANALIKANKEFELVVIPGAHHTMGEAFGDHKRYDFFVRNLLNVTPPTWDKITY